MSVREYIGARYVPVFANPINWNSANTYEPLTIVLHEGNSYTSRQAVPAGVQITNTTYWAQTGNYNAQIEQYRQDVTTLANKFPVSVADGGTGGTTAANARTNLDAAQADGATNTLYDAEQAIAANAANIVSLQSSTFGKRGVAQGDYNDYTGTGIYVINGNMTANQPNPSGAYSGILEVINEGNLMQRYTSTSGKLYFRIKDANGWGAWITVH